MTRIAVTKKCPDCLSYIPVLATQCPACGHRVGPVDKRGMARRPLDWKSYGLFLISLLVLVGFLWWAFW